MAKDNFVELGRVQVNDTTQVVLSEIVAPGGESKGYFLNNWIDSEGYSGPKKGVTIKLNSLAEVLSHFPKEYLQEAIMLKTDRMA